MELYIQTYKTVICVFPFIAITLAGLLDDASHSDVIAVRQRLEEEKSKRMLLQNDVEILMAKVEKMERILDGKQQM